MIKSIEIIILFCIFAAKLAAIKRIMDLLDVYKRLGLEGSDALITISSDKEWKNRTSFPSRVYRLLERNEILSSLKAFFFYDNKPLILFFEKPANPKALHKAIWNFNESPIVIVVSEGNVDIYNGFAIDKNTSFLKSLGGIEKLSDFTYFELVTGKSWEKYHKDLAYSNRVDYHLLANITATQDKLCDDFGLERNLVNALIGKIIFIRYLIDRQVRVNLKGNKVCMTNEDLCNLLKSKDGVWSFLKTLQSKERGFNGDMFKLSEEQFDKIPQEALNVIIRLLHGDDMATGQMSLFQLYDFSILPVEFISNVYERFIGSENQKKQSAYYTPTFLVDYIVEETVGKKLGKDDNNVDCKILDPACGSGIFLVESLRRIIDKYIKVNNLSRKELNTKQYQDALKKLAKDNLFGIDSDLSAIQVAIFSVYLTLLDYQEPADIEEFKFPTMLGENFICADTFDPDNDELKSLINRKIPYDYILGNPPWNRGKVENEENGKRKKNLYQIYVKKRQKAEKVENIVCNNEIAQAFVVRTMDFAGPETKMALIITSKALYNMKSRGFRKYILDNLYIDRVFEMASERKEIFNNSMGDAVAPPCILFYRHAQKSNTDKNRIEHISLKPSRLFRLFRLFGLTKNDIQYIQQNRLKADDRLWKILVYGSYLDYNFIKRLDTYASIQQKLESLNYFIKQGIKEKDGSNKHDVSELLEWNYIKTEYVNRGYLLYDGESKWKIPNVGYVYRDKEKKVVKGIYKAPILLIRGGTGNDLKAVSAISQIDGVYKSSLTGVHVYSDDAIIILRKISSLLNSSFFAYYNIMTFASSGIEREETHDEERFVVPYCDNNAIAENAVTLEGLLTEKASSNFDRSLPNIKEIDGLYRKIDALISEGFDCNQEEMDLIDYANTITIPLIIQHDIESVTRPIQREEVILKEYAQVFLDKFGESFNRNGHRFVAEIAYDSRYIGIFFKVIDEKDFVKDIVEKSNSGGDNLLPVVISISSKKITDRLFVQKDVRDFEKDGFYIFKPNERRLWHRAIAYKDADGFADAMLKAKRQ